MRHFDRSGRQRPADLNSVAVPAGVCQVIQAHGSADTTTGGSESLLMGQPRSSCAWRDLGAATGQLPGAGDPRSSGGCRPGACNACHRDHPPDRRAAARGAGLGARLAALACDTGILSRRSRTTRRNILLKPALSARRRKTTGHKIRAAASSPRHTTRSWGRLGRCQAPGHPDSCRIWPHPPQALELPRLPRLMCPGFPGVGLPDSGHVTGWIWLARSWCSIGVSMPSDQ